ncbi:hypothetical protein CBL_10223 [Carabus blaptoides fortunei]
MATNNTIIFVNNTEMQEHKDIYYKNKLNVCQSVKMHFSVPPYHLLKRIIQSLVPPIFNKHQKIYVDLLGPLLAVLSLTVLLHYGHAAKLPTAASKMSPTEVLLVYMTLMPVVSYILVRLGQSRITLVEIISILGYALFGHILTLTVSMIFYNEESNTFFFLCLMMFGGLSTLRIVLILVALIPKPAVRLIVCSFVSVVQLLLLVFLHFLYMHRTFKYAKNN